MSSLRVSRGAVAQKALQAGGPALVPISAGVLPCLLAPSPSVKEWDFGVNVLKEMYTLHTWLKEPN